MAKCKSCDAEIAFVTMESGKKNPVDLPNPAWWPMPGENVVVKLFDRPGLVVKVPTDRPLIEVFRTHFATCPDAALHRKGRN